LSMDWASSSDNDDNSFTLVENCKRKSGRRKSIVVVSRPLTRSQKGKVVESANSTVSPS
jgi:hypothetical protein